jgi:lysophospholipase L1-like esterase
MHRGQIIIATLLVAASLACAGETLEFRFGPGQTPPSLNVPVAEGNYLVTVTLGHPAADAVTTVKSEQRRLSLERVHTKPGETLTRTFAVNVRTPAIPGGETVKLKPRERQSEPLQWDGQLSLEFLGTGPAVRSIQIEPAADLPTLYLLGDSTVCDQPTEPWASWGQMLPAFLKPTIAVANHAQSGESLRSSLGANRLAKVLSTIRAGDFLLIQFGHNDMKAKGDGVGAFTTYKADLKHYADAARAKGATVLLVTSMERKSFAASGKETLGDYPDAVRQLAREEGLSLIDLHAMSKRLYRSLGRDVDKAFQDGTHHSNYGAYELAKCVVRSVQTVAPALAVHVADDFRTFDPERPDSPEGVAVPASRNSATTKPEGN